MKTFEYSHEEGILRANIEQIATVGSRLMANTHVVTVGCIVHAIEHGRFTLLSVLDSAIGGGYHRSGWRKYVEGYGPVDWQQSDKKNGKEAGFVWNKDKARDLKALYSADPAGFVTKYLSKKWYEVNPDNVYKPVTVLDAVNATIKRLVSAANGKHKDDKRNDFRGLEEFKEFGARLAKALKATKSEPEAGNSEVIDLVALPASAAPAPASVH